MGEAPGGAAERRILLLAPTAADAVLARTQLREAGLEVEIHADAARLSRALVGGAGAVLLTEEALENGELHHLIEAFGGQPQWSEIPVLILAGDGADSPRVAAAMEALDNVTVLERPVRVVTLVSALRSALRARERQFELRDRLATLALLAAVVEGSDDAIVSKTLEGTIVSWNAGAERLFGYSAAEALGRSITLIIPPERLQEEATILARLRAGERLEHFETVRMTKAGRRVDISLTISPIRDAAGTIIGASKVARDITARKLAEESLRESEERFRLLAESLPSIVWTAAPDGTVTYTNRRWLEYTGLGAEVDRRDLPLRVLHPDDRERSLAKWQQHLREGREYENEARHRRHDGAYRWFVTRAFPVRDRDGVVMSWFGVTTDIDERKQAETELREGHRHKDEFLATLAHELRNPLAPLRASLQVLGLAGEQAETRADMVAIMERQLDQLVRLVDDLLEVSRINRGTIELRRARVELGDVVRSAVETSRPLIDAAGQELTVDLPAAPIALEADRVRLAQVLANLLNNAAKFTPAGGSIALAARRAGDEVEIAVRDSGVGIAAEMLPRIFDMFAQGESPRTPHGGLGIGLTIARRLVELHGGHIEARSEGRDRGSEFVVHLPAPELETAPAPRPPAPPAAAVRRRVLVVDDNVDSAESLAAWLGLVGHQARIAHDGASALELAASFAPDAVLLDLGMPDMDGFEVARRLRALPGFERVLLLALTGYGQEDDRRRSREAGFDDHLVKPVDPQSLAALLASSPAPAE
jgi:two-component system CheB/CheR fusion protein